ncbi:MAG: RimK domain protein ATP-grasp [Parcubacteria group bacterium GW2011_GWB1_40_14]|nr:MAG: RimK domain protein ATP-grasp [Parcubacteria group bacterium GW2011_GWB1_40_14]
MTILVVTNSNDPTADFAIDNFMKKNVPFVRLNTDKFLTEIEHEFAIQTGTTPYSMEMKIDGVDLNIDSIKGIWLRRPEDPIPDSSITIPEAKRYCITEANYLLRCLYSLLENRAWVSHPKAITYANVKLHQLEMARKMGLLIPRSLCTNNPDTALKFIGEVKNVVVKPFKANVIETEGTTAVIYTSRVDAAAIKNIATIRFAPTFFQEEIAKVKEYRVTIFGNCFFVTSIDSQSDPNLKLDWRSSSDKPKEWKADDLPDEILRKCFAMVKAYGLNYGAFDFALTPDGQIIFFELNPNGQWAWQEIYLGLPMTDALIRTLGY